MVGNPIKETILLILAPSPSMAQRLSVLVRLSFRAAGNHEIRWMISLTFSHKKLKIQRISPSLQQQRYGKYQQ
jgi:hypothetical protein